MSSPAKQFEVFGEPVEILVTGAMTGGTSTTLTQASPPGVGVPPHMHQHEDETFFILNGDYEFLLHGEWRKVARGEAVYAMRGSVHAFRNVGTTIGKLLIFVAPGGFEKYLEEISPLAIPADMPRILEISERFGISFAN